MRKQLACQQHTELVCSRRNVTYAESERIIHTLPKNHEPHAKHIATICLSQCVMAMNLSDTNRSDSPYVAWIPGCSKTVIYLHTTIFPVPDKWVLCSSQEDRHIGFHSFVLGYGWHLSLLYQCLLARISLGMHTVEIQLSFGRTSYINKDLKLMPIFNDWGLYVPLHNWIHTKYIPTADSSSSWYTSESGHFQEWSETVVSHFFAKTTLLFWQCILVPIKNSGNCALVLFVFCS